MKRVGIYSGTFDPIHAGHLAFAREALAACKLDKVFFLCEPRPRRKQGVKAFEHRVHMVQLAIADDKRLGSIILEQARFTPHKTLPVLQARFKNAELYMLMGDDLLTHFAEWPHVEELLQNIKFVVGVRDDTKMSTVRERLKLIEKTKGIAFRCQLFKSKESSLNSSKLRLELRKGQRPEGLPIAVQAYINKHDLYSKSK